MNYEVLINRLIKFRLLLKNFKCVKMKRKTFKENKLIMMAGNIIERRNWAVEGNTYNTYCGTLPTGVLWCLFGWVQGVFHKKGMKKH